MRSLSMYLGTQINEMSKLANAGLFLFGKIKTGRFEKQNAIVRWTIAHRVGYRRLHELSF